MCNFPSSEGNKICCIQFSISEGGGQPVIPGAHVGCKPHLVAFRASLTVLWQLNGLLTCNLMLQFPAIFN